MNEIVFIPDNVSAEKLSARAEIMRIQESCQALDDGHRMDESPPVKNWLMPGIYCREIHLPADSVVVGRIHKFEHLSIISKGRVTVFTESGETTHKAGDSFSSPPGTKRVVWAHEDTTWTTIHPNPDNETDIAKLENRYTAMDYAELNMIVGKSQETLK